ncbi:unnamed protein product [Polarella glacialis]|uniref:Uncharacterized protein n=1 Tax=Polarella glacialis TaxID=89957 RepID=A0A813HCX2_POLGL|nr:unnamed protein product [Polarella glacialis]
MGDARGGPPEQLPTLARSLPPAVSRLFDSPVKVEPLLSYRGSLSSKRLGPLLSHSTPPHFPEPLDPKQPRPRKRAYSREYGVPRPEAVTPAEPSSKRGLSDAHAMRGVAEAWAMRRTSGPQPCLPPSMGLTPRPPPGPRPAHVRQAPWATLMATTVYSVPLARGLFPRPGKRRPQLSHGSEKEAKGETAREFPGGRPAAKLLLWARRLVYRAAVVRLHQAGSSFSESPVPSASTLGKGKAGSSLSSGSPDSTLGKGRAGTMQATASKEKRAEKRSEKSEIRPMLQERREADQLVAQASVGKALVSSVLQGAVSSFLRDNMEEIDDDCDIVEAI